MRAAAALPPLLLLAVLLPVAASDRQLAASASDAELLLAFRRSFTNGKEILSGWARGTDHCAWSGVNCAANGTVERL